MTVTLHIDYNGRFENCTRKKSPLYNAHNNRLDFFYNNMFVRNCSYNYERSDNDTALRIGNSGTDVTMVRRARELLYKYGGESLSSVYYNYVLKPGSMCVAFRNLAEHAN